MKLKFLFSAVLMTLSLFAAPSPQYFVIDLSGGTDATEYSYYYLDDVPEGGWTDEYKTTKLVLRKISAGTFTMGSPAEEYGRGSNENQHTVRLTKDFWIGVFEVTQRQWELVLGNRPSVHEYGPMRPVENVSYNGIRGDNVGAGWPANDEVDYVSFIGMLRGKVKTLKFDLPTEAQWEYACRAGTETAFNNNKDSVFLDHYKYEGLDEVARYYGNNYDEYRNEVGTATVGEYMPNNWGLYDMHGNVEEWCLDWYGVYPEDATDPVGASSDRSRIVRGGNSISFGEYCRSAARGFSGPSHCGRDTGFRLAASPYEFKYVASDVEGTYRGQEGYQIKVEVKIPREGYTIKYSPSEIGPWTEDLVYVDACEATKMYFELSAPNYTSVTGSANVTIAKRPLTLTSQDKSKGFDGAALTFGASEITAEGYVEGEELEYSGFATILDIGEKEAAYEIADSSTAKLSNYAITKNYGKLTVTEPVINLPEDVCEKSAIQILEYDSAGAGVTDAEVRVKINGITVLERTTGKGVINWLDTAKGSWHVTYDFFANGRPVRTKAAEYVVSEGGEDALNQFPVEFAKAKYTVMESAKSVKVKVKRLTKKGALTVKYTTFAGTAKPGEDYYPVTGELTWKAGETAHKTITIRLLPDLVNKWEENKDFSVVLSSPMIEAVDASSHFVRIGAMAKTLVSIKESARKPANKTPAAAGIIAASASRSFQGVGGIVGSIEGFAHEKLALINATLSAKGAISAKVKAGGKTIGFKAKADEVTTLSDGRLEATMQAVTKIGKTRLNNVLVLRLPPAEGGEGLVPEAECTVVMREGTSKNHHVNRYHFSLVADLHNVDITPEALAKYQGYYTLALPGETPAAGTPPGAGYLTLTIDKKGKVKAAGKLGDGTSVAVSTVPGVGEGELKLPLYYANGSVAFGGELVLKAAEEQEARVFASACRLLWINSSDNATWAMTPGGFERELAVNGGYYNTLWNLERYYLDSQLTLGEFAPVKVTGNALTIDKPFAHTLKFNRATGVFKGVIKAPEKWNYAGVLIMKEDGVLGAQNPATPGWGHRTRTMTRSKDTYPNAPKYLDSLLLTIESADVSAENAELWASEGERLGL